MRTWCEAASCRAPADHSRTQMTRAALVITGSSVSSVRHTGLGRTHRMTCRFCCARCRNCS